MEEGREERKERREEKRKQIEGSETTVCSASPAFLRGGAVAGSPQHRGGTPQVNTPTRSVLVNSGDSGHALAHYYQPFFSASLSKTVRLTVDTVLSSFIFL